MTRLKAKPRLTFYLSGLATGGAERHALELAARLAERGSTTSLLVHGRTSSPTMTALVGDARLDVLGLRRMSDLRALPRVRESVRASAPDVLICINQSTAIWAMLLRRLGLFKGRIACIFHTTQPGPEDRLTLPIFLKLARSLDLLVYVSRNQAAYWRCRGLAARSEVVIVNGVDSERFRPDERLRSAQRPTFGAGRDTLVVGLVAAFRPEKNHVQLVEACARLRGRGTDLVLVLVGDGPTRDLVGRRVAELGLEAHVTFLGERGDVPRILPAFDVTVLCSTAVETFSLAALESLACGVPVIMSDIGGASEIVQPDLNGLLVAPGDLDALTSALARLADVRLRRGLAANARSSVQHLTVAAMVRAYLDAVDVLCTAAG